MVSQVHTERCPYCKRNASISKSGGIMDVMSDEQFNIHVEACKGHREGERYKRNSLRPSVESVLVYGDRI